jgi:hypothetical protein
MDGATAMRKGQRRWSHASSEREMAARRATQGGGDVTKGDATTSHRSEREANERRKAQADKSRFPHFPVRSRHRRYCFRLVVALVRLGAARPPSLSFLSPHSSPQNDRKKSTPLVPPRSRLISNASPPSQPIFGWLLCLLTKRGPPQVEAPPSGVGVSAAAHWRRRCGDGSGSATAPAARRTRRQRGLQQKIRQQGEGVIPKIKQSHFIVIWLPR